MAPDLSGLERAALEAGLGALRARVVPADRRRGGWFRWTATELFVSERVLERLRPAEGAALLIHAVAEACRLAAWRRRVAPALGAGVALLTAGGAHLGASPAWLVPALFFLAVVLGLAGRSRALQQADDDAVLRLGDPELLVRALNTIHQDELRVGSLSLPARPDIHQRAERLVALHELRVPAGQRRLAAREPRRGA